MFKRIKTFFTFANFAKMLGTITIVEISFWGMSGFCILRGKNFKSLFSVYVFNSRLFFQFFYLPEISIKVNKKYAIDIINFIVFVPIALNYYAHNEEDNTARVIFYGYLAYMLFIFFFTDAHPQNNNLPEIEMKEEQKLIEKGH